MGTGLKYRRRTVFGHGSARHMLGLPHTHSWNYPLYMSRTEISLLQEQVRGIFPLFFLSFIIYISTAKFNLNGNSVFRKLAGGHSFIQETDGSPSELSGMKF